jgi:hypothetical protein
VYKARHPDLFLFSQRRMIKQAELQTQYTNTLRGMVDAEIELRKSETQWDHIDQILDTVGMRIQDEHAEAAATIAENNYKRQTRIMDAELENLRKREELAKAKAKDADPGDEQTAEYWEREAQKQVEEERGRDKIAREKRKLKRARIKELKAEMNDELDEFVRDEKRRFGREINLKEPDSWSEDDRAIVEEIRYQYEQLIEDLA